MHKYANFFCPKNKTVLQSLQTTQLSYFQLIKIYEFVCELKNKRGFGNL